MKKAKILMVLTLVLSVALTAGCTTKKATTYPGQGDLTMITEEEVDVSLKEAVTEVIQGEPDVYTLIDNGIKIGSSKYDLEKVPMDQNSTEYDTYHYYVNKDLYGYVSNGKVVSFIARFDGNHISMDKAEEIASGLLPDDAKFLEAYTEDVYTHHLYTSSLLADTEVIEVRFACMGRQVQAVGVTVTQAPDEETPY